LSEVNASNPICFDVFQAAIAIFSSFEVNVWQRGKKINAYFRIFGATNGDSIRSAHSCHIKSMP
jgi:hypothetical protein